MPLRPLTVLVTACGAPGAAALLRALRENGEREVRLVGTDMSDRAAGRFLCDAFALVPPGGEPGFPEALLAVARREGADAVLPESSHELLTLAEARGAFDAAGIPVLVASPEAVRRSNDKEECYRTLAAAGVRVPDFRRVTGRSAFASAAEELGYPRRPVCFKPVRGSGARGFRVLDPTVDRTHQLLHERPGSLAMLLEDVAALLPEDGGPELLVMELARGEEQGFDGIARDGRVLFGHPKIRGSFRAGLAMYCETIEDPALEETGRRAVAALGLDHFFNVQFVGGIVNEVNPRISSVVYQEDVNLPYLGVRHALGEIGDEELAAVRPLVRPGRRLQRYFDQVDWDE